MAHADFTATPTVAIKPRAATSPDAAPMPWYARAAHGPGRPAVLVVVLAMCMPGEYHLARLAGWDDPWAYGAPATLSLYAGIAAVVAAHRPPGAPGKRSASVGAIIALVLAMTAQIVAHLITKGHVTGESPLLVAVVSAVPPLVAWHLLHLAGQRDNPGVAPVATEPPPEPTRPPADADPRPPKMAAATPPVADPDARGEMLTTGEVVEMLNVRPATVRSWVARGKLTPVATDPATKGHLFATADVAALCDEAAT